MSEPRETRLTGGCLCGAVRYEIHQAPILAYTCHCTDCQHLTGAAFGIGVVVTEAGFHWSGPTRVQESVADSGGVKRRHVCAVCGVWVFGDPRPEGVRVIRGGTFDTTTWLRPTTHFWLRRKQPWIVLPDGDQCFDTQPDDYTEIQVPPTKPPGTDVQTTENPLPDYFNLLLAASRASEAVDRFDLRSDDPDSVIAFRTLRQESLQATMALLDYSVTHNDTIKEWLTGE